MSVHAREGEALYGICAHCIYSELSGPNAERVYCHRHVPDNPGGPGAYHLETEAGDWCGDGAWLVYSDAGALQLASLADIKFYERLQEDIEDRRAEQGQAA